MRRFIGSAICKGRERRKGRKADHGKGEIRKKQTPKVQLATKKKTKEEY